MGAKVLWNNKKGERGMTPLIKNGIGLIIFGAIAAFIVAYLQYAF